jgi:hypothetical protein
MIWKMDVVGLKSSKIFLFQVFYLEDLIRFMGSSINDTTTNTAFFTPSYVTFPHPQNRGLGRFGRNFLEKENNYSYKNPYSWMTPNSYTIATNSGKF